MGSEPVVREYALQSEAGFAINFAKATSNELLGELSSSVVAKKGSLGAMPLVVGQQPWQGGWVAS